jgi:RNA polymerase sigma-70 factor (ECF subfamily)
LEHDPDTNKLSAQHFSAATKGTRPMNDESTAVLQSYLQRGLTGDTEARQRLLELTRDRMMRHARRFLHGRYARLEPFAQTDDVVQQLYIKILQNQDRFWLNARGEPVQTLAEFFGHTSAWMRDVLCDLLRKEYGRDDNRPAVLPLDGGPTDTGPQHEPSSMTLEAGNVQRWTEFHEAVARLPDELRVVFDLLWYQEMSQAEAAALLGIAVPTVKLRWMKARLQVQQALGGSPFDDGSPPERTE